MKDDAGKFRHKRWPEGLLAAEALIRAQPADDRERDAFLELFDAIERGAITGAHDGLETLKDRAREEGDQ